MEEMVSISDYLKPLMEFMASLPEEERVILVGHGYGGICVSCEKFPKKISVAVFVAAIMPRCRSPPINLFEELSSRTHIESRLDCEFSYDLGRENLPTSLILGPDFLSSKMYNCCPTEDTLLATLLVEPISFFFKDLANEKWEKFGSVNRVYIICGKEKVVKEDFQRWMIYNGPILDVRVIECTGHMVMLSKPEKLCKCLKEIAEKYA